MLTPLRVTEKQGEDYIDECAAAGVPIPPTWGTSGWGRVESRTRCSSRATPSVRLRKDVAAARGSACPSRVCRRRMDVSLLGVICQGNDTRQGNDTSKVCFWDNADVPVGDEVPLAEFEGART